MGQYRLSGVDRESGFETELIVHASTEANARAMGAAKGMIVTRLEERRGTVFVDPTLIPVPAPPPLPVPAPQPRLIIRPTERTRWGWMDWTNAILWSALIVASITVAAVYFAQSVGRRERPVTDNGWVTPPAPARVPVILDLKAGLRDGVFVIENMGRDRWHTLRLTINGAYSCDVLPKVSVGTGESVSIPPFDLTDGRGDRFNVLRTKPITIDVEATLLDGSTGTWTGQFLPNLTDVQR